VILKYRLAKRWAKNGVVTIAKWIKRKWSKLCRKRLCNPKGVTRNEFEFRFGVHDSTPAIYLRIPQVFGFLGAKIHDNRRKLSLLGAKASGYFWNAQVVSWR